jgi:hypothetical protein
MVDHNPKSKYLIRQINKTTIKQFPNKTEFEIYIKDWFEKNHHLIKYYECSTNKGKDWVSVEVYRNNIDHKPKQERLEKIKMNNSKYQFNSKRHGIVFFDKENKFISFLQKKYDESRNTASNSSYSFDGGKTWLNISLFEYHKQAIQNGTKPQVEHQKASNKINSGQKSGNKAQEPVSSGNESGIFRYLIYGLLIWFGLSLLNKYGGKEVPVINDLNNKMGVFQREEYNNYATILRILLKEEGTIINSNYGGGENYNFEILNVDNSSNRYFDGRVRLTFNGQYTGNIKVDRNNKTYSYSTIEISSGLKDALQIQNKIKENGLEVLKDVLIP